METGRIVSNEMDNYLQLYINWFEHRDGVDFKVLTFKDHYEIYWQSENNIGDELNEFIELFEGPGERTDYNL